MTRKQFKEIYDTAKEIEEYTNQLVISKKAAFKIRLAAQEIKELVQKEIGQLE